MSIRTVTALVLASAIALAAHAQETENNEAQAGRHENNRQTNPPGTQEAPIRLESIFIGDKEQPAISYFVPWEEIGAPDQLHWNVEEKYDEALKAVDRDIMLRSMRLYGELNLEANAP